MKRWFVEATGRTYLDAWLGQMSGTYGASVEWSTSNSSDNRENRERTRKQSPFAPSKVDAYTALFLLPDAPAPLVKAAYRELAKLHHPDAGGTTEGMQKINEAYRQLAA